MIPSDCSAKSNVTSPALLFQHVSFSGLVLHGSVALIDSQCVLLRL